MMKKKKSGFWLFIWSLFPGTGHMYMGFMKMGLSFLLGFMLLLIVMSVTKIDALVVLPITLYIYSFFHANNLGGLKDEEFEAIEDTYLFGVGDLESRGVGASQSNRKAAAVILIVIGVYMLWNMAFDVLRELIGLDDPVLKAVYYFMRNDVPRAAIGIAVIWFGVVLLRGKRIVAEQNNDRIEQVGRIEQKDGENSEERV